MVKASVSIVRVSLFHSCFLCLSSILVTFLIFLVIEQGPSWRGCPGSCPIAYLNFLSMLLLDVLELLNPRPNLFGLIDGLYHHLLNTATPSGHHVLPMGPNFLLAPAFESLFPEVSSNLRVIFMPNLSFFPGYAIVP